MNEVLEKFSNQINESSKYISLSNKYPRKYERIHTLKSQL